MLYLDIHSQISKKNYIYKGKTTRSYVLDVIVDLNIEIFSK